MNHREEFSTLHKLNEHIKAAVILKGAYQIDHERVVDGRHDILLTNYSLDLMVPNDLSLAQHFKCIGLASLLVTDKPDLAKGTDAQDPELDQVFELDAAIQLGTDRREGLPSLDTFPMTLSMALLVRTPQVVSCSAVIVWWLMTASSL